jgi:hypothetical protein
MHIIKWEEFFTNNFVSAKCLDVEKLLFVRKVHYSGKTIFSVVFPIRNDVFSLTLHVKVGRKKQYIVPDNENLSYVGQTFDCSRVIYDFGL